MRSPVQNAPGGLTTPLTAVALWSAMFVLASMPDRVPNALSVFGLLSVTAGGEEVPQQVAVLAGLSITLLAALLLVSTHDMVRGRSRNRRTAGPLPGAWIVAISAAASVLLASGAALTVAAGSGSALTVSLFAAVGGLVQFLLYLVVMLTAAYLSAARWLPVVVIVMLATLPPPGVRIPWLPIHAAFDSALTTHSTRAALGNLAVLLAGLIVVTGLSYVITSTHDLRAASSLPRPRRHP